MNEETTITAKTTTEPQPKPLESQFGGVSIRAWLALIVIGSVAMIECGRAYFCFFTKAEYAVNGEFMMLASGIMAHYFSEKKPQITP